MNFIFVKSQDNEKMGAIQYVYSYLPTNDDTLKSRNVTYVQTESNPRKKIKRKRTKASLGFELSHEEWLSFNQGKYKPDAIMPSLGITYAKFGKFMDMIRKTVDENRDRENVKIIVQNVILKAITSTTIY